MAKPFRVLGVDTSLRSTGLGVVEMEGSKLSFVDMATVKVPQKELHTECLRRISTEVTKLIDQTHPDAISIEGVFFSKNAKTALILGEARGTVISICACRGLPVFEYAPKKIKMAVTGTGTASKLQVRKMVMKLLSMSDEPQEDAGDALAIAICHLHNRSGHAALAPKEV